MSVSEYVFRVECEINNVESLNLIIQQVISSGKPAITIRP